MVNTRGKQRNLNGYLKFKRAGQKKLLRSFYGSNFCPSWRFTVAALGLIYGSFTEHSFANWGVILIVGEVIFRAGRPTIEQFIRN